MRLERNCMTDIKTKADKALSAYYDDEAHDPAFHLTGILREVINQLQQSPGVIMCADMLELCEEIENFYIEQEKEQIKQNLKLSLKNYD